MATFQPLSVNILAIIEHGLIFSKLATHELLNKLKGYPLGLNKEFMFALGSLWIK
jgi:hypothetical protein